LSGRGRNLVSASDLDFDIHHREMADNRHEVFDEQMEADGFYVVTSFEANKRAAHNTSAIEFVGYLGRAGSHSPGAEPA
jgi:hypothetical protein